MAYIFERKGKKGSRYYLRQRVNGIREETYLGTKRPGLNPKGGKNSRILAPTHFCEFGNHNSILIVPHKVIQICEPRKGPYMLEIIPDSLMIKDGTFTPSSSLAICSPVHPSCEKAKIR